MPLYKKTADALEISLCTVEYIVEKQKYVLLHTSHSFWGAFISCSAARPPVSPFWPFFFVRAGAGFIKNKKYSDDRRRAYVDVRGGAAHNSGK